MSLLDVAQKKFQLGNILRYLQPRQYTHQREQQPCQPHTSSSPRMYNQCPLGNGCNWHKALMDWPHLYKG